MTNRASSPRPAARNGNARTSYMSVPGDPPAPGDPLLKFKPAKHKKPRRNTVTAAKQREFIAALAATGIVTQAAKVMGASTSALYAFAAQARLGSLLRRVGPGGADGRALGLALPRRR